MERIPKGLGHQVVMVGLIASLVLSPIYSLALERNYMGNVFSVSDIAQMPTVYHYDNTEGDSGRYIEAMLGAQNTAVHNVYMPVSIAVSTALGHMYTVSSQCHIGQLCAQELGNGDVTVYDYHYNLKNNPYRSLRQKTVYQPVKGTTPIYREMSQARYHYDFSGELRLSQTQSWLSGGQFQQTISSNAYDLLGRLVSSNTSGPKSSQSDYRYDANSNLVRRANANSPLSVVINGIGEALLINGQSIAYDGNGNELIQAKPHQIDPSGTFQFNARNQLVGYKQGSQQYLYGYSANGIRWYKSQLGNPVGLHYYNKGSQLLNTVETRQQKEQAERQDTSHYLLAGQHISRLVMNLPSQKMTNQYYLPGQKGNVRGHLNQAGQLTDTAQYTAYGELLNKTQSKKPSIYQTDTHPIFDLQSHDPFAYDGEQRDVETKLIYLRARYYDPGTGRFISQDGYNLMNRYGFAQGDPVDRVDPKGHSSFFSSFRFWSLPLQVLPIDGLIGEWGFANPFIGGLLSLISTASIGALANTKDWNKNGLRRLLQAAEPLALTWLSVSVFGALVNGLRLRIWTLDKS